MKIIKKSLAGTLESNDIQIMISPNEEKGIEIELTSNVEKQFGRQIRRVIKETIEKLGVEDAIVFANDKGALDCTIQARVQCAVFRGCDTEGKYNWEVID